MSRIEIDDEVKRLIDSRLATGEFEDVSELLKTALTTLTMQDSASEIQSSLEAIREGIEDARAGRHRSIDEVFGEME